MEFIDKLGSFAYKTYDYTTCKTNKIVKESKLKLKIKDNKMKIEDLYEEMGKKLYQKHIREEEYNIKNDILDYCEKVDKISKEIEESRKEILHLNDRKECPNCYTKINAYANYCYNCGKYQNVDETETSINKETNEEEFVDLGSEEEN